MRYKNFSATAWTLAGALLVSGGALAQTGNLSNVPDAQVEANVLKALAGSPQLASENITTNTVYGTVTLSGSVRDEPTRKLAETLASQAPGVKKVVDELTLGGSGVASNGGGQETNPMLQSDGTVAQPGGQSQTHAPDPDTYAAQHGMTQQQGDPTNQNTAPDASGGYTQPPQPGYRQPYNNQPPQGFPQGNQNYPPNQPPYGSPQQQGGGYPQNNQGYPQNQQGYPPNQQPYAQPGSRPQQPPPPPYGAQAAGQPVTVPQGAMLRIRINEGLDSKHSQPGTPFDAIVLNDVVADGAVAIPRGASVQGHVVDAKSGGVLAGHGELSLQLTQLTLGGKTFPIASDVWTRNSSDKGLQTANNAIGLGAAGAIIGAIAGGGAGAAIGAGAGGLAGVGTSAASGSRQVLVPSEAILTFHLAQPAPVTTISQAEMDRLSYGVPAGASQQPQMRRRYPAPYYGPVYYPRPYGYPYPY